MLQANPVPPELPLGKGRLVAHRTFSEALTLRVRILSCLSRVWRFPMSVLS